MAWTYATTLATNRDKVRLLIGDTNTNAQLLQDEELCFAESEFGPNIYATALAALDFAIVELSRSAESKSVGPLSLNYGDRAARLTAARARVEALAMKKAGVPIPYAGGISVADKEIDEADDDVVGHHFQVGGFDNPGAADDRDLTRIRDRDDL